MKKLVFALALLLGALILSAGAEENKPEEICKEMQGCS